MNDNFLTPDGRQRRSQILRLAMGEARRRRRKRWIAPLGVTVVALVVMDLALLRPGAPVHMFHRPRGLIVRTTHPPATEPSIAIQYVETDPTITDRLSIKGEPPRWTSIGDDELLNELAEAGQPAGLAYVNGRAILLMKK